MSLTDSARFMRQAMVDALKRRGDLIDPRIEAAFLAVPRHLFLPGLSLEQAYANEAVPIKREPDGTVISSASQPSMIAIMLRQLGLQSGDNVLEIGAGSGYNAALMQHIVGEEGHVTTVELDQDIADQARANLQQVAASNVRVVVSDAASGYAPRAAYDRIIATVGVWDIPSAWHMQLKPPGVLVAPVWLDAFQISAAFRQADDGTLHSENNHPCGFIRMRGLRSGPSVTRRVGSSSLVLMSNAAPKLDSAAMHLLLSEGAEESLLPIRLSAADYWNGFLPYLVLNIPAGFTFATYNITTNQQAYGIGGHGFALVGQTGAVFVPYDGHGEVLIFAAMNALMALQDVLLAWDADGRPGTAQTRVRLLPVRGALPEVQTGKVYMRIDHYIHVWQETGV